MQGEQQANTTVLPQVWDTISSSPAGQDVSDPPLVIGHTEQGYFATNFSYSGYMEYNFGELRPQQLYIDVNVTSSDSVPLMLNVTTAYNDTVALSETSLTGDIYGIPGVLEIQPSLQYSAGAEIIATSAMAARTNLTNIILDGHIHLDLVNPDNTYIGGLWDGNFGSGVAIDPVGTISIGPFISLTAVMAVNVTDTNRGFYQAFKSTAKSTYEFQLAGSDDCTRTAYGFNIDAFNLDGWRKTLYGRQDPFTEGCR